MPRPVHQGSLCSYVERHALALNIDVLEGLGCLGLRVVRVPFACVIVSGLALGEGGNVESKKVACSRALALDWKRMPRIKYTVVHDLLLENSPGLTLE